jgi:hypothetical protein
MDLRPCSQPRLLLRACDTSSIGPMPASGGFRAFDRFLTGLANEIRWPYNRIVRSVKSCADT